MPIMLHIERQSRQSYTSQSRQSYDLEMLYLSLWSGRMSLDFHCPEILQRATYPQLKMDDQSVESRTAVITETIKPRDKY